MNAKPPGIVERLLAERIGLDPSSVGETLITRGVHARMGALGLKSKTDYERTLLENRDELQALVEEVVVPESWFFRDEKPFEVLDRLAREGWIGNPGRPPLTALSLPCASGEEPYSIAMTLLDSGLSGDRFRVDAVDVSARSLARAIAGVYGSNAFRGTASARRSAYFREQNGAFTLDLAVRSSVRFHLGNLLDPTLFADRAPFDVVFCRNVLIYLDDHANALAFDSLTRLVAEGGLLFLGHADRLEVLEDSPFEPIADKGAFAYRKGLIPSPGPVPCRGGLALPITRGPLPLSGPVPRGAGLAPPITQGRQGKPYPTEKDRAGPPPQVVREAETPKPVVNVASESLLDQASELADSGQYVEASAMVDRAISSGLASARAYFLLGMIAQASGDRDRAEAHYLKAIYLDAQHDEALLALALLARRKGDVAAESSYRRRAERVRSRKVIP